MLSLRGLGHTMKLIIRLETLVKAWPGCLGCSTGHELTFLDTLAAVSGFYIAADYTEPKCCNGELANLILQ